VGDDAGFREESLAGIRALEAELRMAEREFAQLSNQLLLQQAEGERDRANERAKADRDRSDALARRTLLVAALAAVSTLGQCVAPIYKIFRPDIAPAPIAIPAPIVTVTVPAPTPLVIPAPIVSVIVPAAGARK